MNRLLTANYGEGNAFTSNSGGYDVTIGVKAANQNIRDAYDLNGNIKNLSRTRAGTLIDKLSYEYTGNQLRSVNDAANDKVGFTEKCSQDKEYNYDLNGNMIADKNKGLAKVEYNHLNLPVKLTGDDNKTITYIYDANGQKLKKIADGTETWYAGNFVYEKEKGKTSSLKYILHSEGKYDLSGTKGQYQFNLKNHLGNVRMVVDVNGKELQQSAYYPFGMQYMASVGAENKYLYNGKELQDDKLNGESLDWYDYGARFYDASLARWQCIDPLAEATEDYSPYHYANNNPLVYNDPTGMIGENFRNNIETTVVHSETGEVFEVNDGFDFVFYVSDEEFKEIKSSGQILGTSAFNRWWKEFLSDIAYELGKSESNNKVDNLLQEWFYDDISLTLSSSLNGDYGNLAWKLAGGKLKRLKKLARWVFKQKSNVKIPGTEKGGATFNNNKKKLPTHDDNGKPITYKEYDIKPAPQHGANRGKERMVLGSDGKAYYTRDHYETFTQFKY
ncbi:hypothetical protein DMA11_11785 [Marinilabiliaceae bacterium JC017]|nr:hypothetical protein DMA11_11785 [Marinilabiliaceae bacterium JC017]